MPAVVAPTFVYIYRNGLILQNVLDGIITDCSAYMPNYEPHGGVTLTQVGAVFHCVQMMKARGAGISLPIV